MSGAELSEGHKLIQIGVAVDSTADGTRLTAPDLFCSLIGWDDTDLPWSERAEQVHHLPRELVLAAPRAAQVDEDLVAWLTGHGVDPAHRGVNWMCGFNVGAFDSPFVRAALPRSTEMFARRYLDLNPLLALMGTSAGTVIGGTPGAGNPAAWKRRFRQVGLDVVASVGRTEGEHDAGTDALQALGAWRHVQDVVSGLDIDAAQTRQRRRAERKAAARAEHDAGTA